jgi:hypothetical protein
VTLDDLCRDIGDKGLVLYLLRKNVSENCSWIGTKIKLLLVSNSRKC